MTRPDLHTAIITSRSTAYHTLIAVAGVLVVVLLIIEVMA